MEFKGTKGNWKLVNNEYGYYTSVRNSNDTRKICVSRVNDQTENNANLLLISKAPEMLEMLINIKNINKIAREHITEVLFEKLEKLIESATTI